MNKWLKAILETLLLISVSIIFSILCAMCPIILKLFIIGLIISFITVCVIALAEE